MSQRRSFIRKIAYVCAIAVLLLPLSWLSAPATSGGNDGMGTLGGRLAQLREQNNLGQANLGEIDPASETIKLATLGMHGVAANLLWEKANHYKKTEDWTNLSATLEQITKLQPNFVSVWQFQAWNLSYNVSVEFDDYRDRYYWVIRGINFLKEGEKYNKDEPRLLWDIGWFIAQKIGRADEHKQFRRLFKDDDDFHPADRPRERRDNWLVGKEWFTKSQNAVDFKGKQLRVKGKGKSDLIFFADAAMCQINYSDAIEGEGVHGEVAKQAWKKSGQEWFQYGNRRLQHTSGHGIRLNDMERLDQRADDLEKQLGELVVGLRDSIEQERRNSLSEEQRQALDLIPGDLDQDQYELVREARRILRISPEDVASRIQEDAPDKGVEATRLARAAVMARRRARDIDRYRNIVNFDYWRTRCEFEQTSEALTARELIYQGYQAFLRGDLLQAKRLYDQGLASWRTVLDNYPDIVVDPTTGDDLMDVIKDYRRILDQVDEPFPQDFILRDIIEEHDSEGEFKDVLTPAAEPPAATENEQED